MIELKNIILNLCKYERFGSEYYKVIDFSNNLEQINNLEVISDVVLIPFYLTPNATFEIYDYELNIRNVSQSNKIDYFLKKTGKKNLNEISPEILEKLELCYIEVINGENIKTLLCIKKYLKYILYSNEVQERIPVELGKYNNKNLYFEVSF